MKGKHIIYKQVEKFANVAAFPIVGNEYLLYYAEDVNSFYAWNGASYDLNVATPVSHTHTASEVTDFDTEVANNTDVAANTLKVSNVTTNLSIGTKTGTTVDVDSSDGTNATVPAATDTEAGLMTAANKLKLDGVEAGAQVSNHLGTFAADPVTPVSGGETYYNSTLNATMVYDLSRTKWVALSSIVYGFSRNGNTAAGSYFNMAGSILMTPTVTGYPTVSNSVLTSIQLSRSDLDAITIEIAADGVAVGEITLGINITSGTVALNADITHPAILTARVKAGTNTVTDCAGAFTIKLKV